MSVTPTFEDRALPVSFDRAFYLNRFVATHRSLLLRSPKGDSDADRIDILFKGVVAVKFLSELQKLTIRVASKKERASIERDCGVGMHTGDDLNVFILDGGPRPGYIVALSMFASRDQRHGANPSPLLFDLEGEPVPSEVLYRYGTSS